MKWKNIHLEAFNYVVKLSYRWRTYSPHSCDKCSDVKNWLIYFEHRKAPNVLIDVDIPHSC